MMTVLLSAWGRREWDTESFRVESNTVTTVPGVKVAHWVQPEQWQPHLSAPHSARPPAR